MIQGDDRALIFCLVSLAALCGSPDSPENGQVAQSGSSIGDTATYSCNNGFELVGDEQATCTQSVDGGQASFQPAAPNCLRKCKYWTIFHTCHSVCFVLSIPTSDHFRSDD